MKRRSVLRRSGVRVATAVVVTIALVLALLWIFQRRLIYLPDSSPVPSAGDVLPGAFDVSLKTDDGLTLSAWYLPAADGACRAVFLVAPGNGGNRLNRVPLARALSDGGYGVMLMEYRGYGGNPGSPTEAGLASDARAAYQYLTEQAGLTAGQLVYFGESLGGAVVTGLAAEHPPAAVVLRSPFADLAAAAGVHYPFLLVRLLLRDHFPVAQLVPSLTMPITVVYGTADSVIPPEQSRQVAAASGTPADLVAVGGADHNDPALVFGPQVIDAANRAAAHASCSGSR